MSDRTPRFCNCNRMGTAGFCPTHLWSGFPADDMIHPEIHNKERKVFTETELREQTQVACAVVLEEAAKANCSYCAGPSKSHPGYVKLKVCWCEKLRLWGDPSNSIKVPHHHYVNDRGAEYIQKCTGEHIRSLIPNSARIVEEHLNRKSVFVDGEFVSHSGLTLPDKIEADNFTDSEIILFAKLIAKDVGHFCYVVGVPRGGNRLQMALSRYETHDPNDPLLVVDDVFTTGKSITDWRDRGDKEAARRAVGYVIFARGLLPSWVRALYYDQRGLAEHDKQQRMLAAMKALEKADVGCFHRVDPQNCKQCAAWDWARAGAEL